MIQGKRYHNGFKGKLLTIERILYIIENTVKLHVFSSLTSASYAGRIP